MYTCMWAYCNWAFLNSPIHSFSACLLQYWCVVAGKNGKGGWEEGMEREGGRKGMVKSKDDVIFYHMLYASLQDSVSSNKVVGMYQCEI